MSARGESKARPLLLVTNDLGPRAGGIETFILGLLMEISHHGIPGDQIVIYTSSQPGDRAFDQELFDKHGIVVIRDRAKILLPSPRVNRDVIKVMRTYKSQIVWFGAAAPLGWMSGALRRAGVERIVTLSHGHEVWWSKVFPFSLIMRRIGSNVDVLTYLGEFTRDAIRPALGDHPRLVHIAPGIDTEHFTPGVKSQELLESFGLTEKKIIVSVGRLVHRKGQDRLIEAMPKILKAIPNAYLFMIGEGPYKRELEKLVAKHNLAQHVRFVGRLNYSQLPEHIRMGDVFAMPSRSRFFGLEVEGLGIVYLEASACGLPVVAGQSGGAPDAVLEGKTGLVVDGTDINEVARACVEILSDLDNAKKMGLAGRSWIESDWDWKIWGKRFAELLQK